MTPTQGRPGPHPDRGEATAIRATTAFIQRRLLLLVLASYLLAGLAPGPGVALRAAGPWLLALLMFTAGLDARLTDLGRQFRRPGRLLLGVAANAVLPAVVLPAVAVAVSGWHDNREATGLLIGLALVLSMPIAGSAATWGHNAGGNLALAVGMVLGSALLSPLTIPLGLGLAGRLTPDLASLTHLSTGCSLFAAATVVLPCLAGLAARHLLGPRRTDLLTPWTKTLTLADILLLGYISAATALAGVITHPDPDLLALATVLAAAVCVALFLLGRWLAARARSDRRDTISLTYATGMTNTSAAAVLAATWFTHQPAAIVLILAYGLLQRATAATLRHSQ